MFNMTQETKIRSIAVPKSWASTAATTEWIDMRAVNQLDFVVHTGAWAGGTAAVTLKQAINASGSSSAALGFVAYDTNDGSTSTDTLTLTAAASSTFNLDTANAVYKVSVRPDMLTSGKTHVRIAVASPGANADYYGIVAIGQTKFKAASPPTMIG